MPMRLVIDSSKQAKIALYLFLFFFVVFYFGDGVTKFLYKSDASYHRYGIFIKAFSCLVVIAYGLIFLNRRKLNLFLLMGILTSFFLIGQYCLSLKFHELDFIENLNTNFKYLFLFIFYILVIDIKKFKTFPEIIYIVYQFILGINCVLTILGFIFKIDLLTTYGGRWRFGYDGLILAQNEASFIYIFALTIVYYRKFFLKKNEIFFWIVLFPSLIVATKAVYIYIALLFIFHLFFKLPIRQALSFIIGMGLIGYLAMRTTINKILSNSLEFFMYRYERYGLLTALLSGRDAFINEKLIPLMKEYWIFPNYLFGGQDVMKFYIEMGLFDLFLFYGIIGMILFLYAFIKIYQTLDFPFKFKLFFGISLMMIVATAGHFFESGIAGIHFIMLLLICKNWNTNSLKIDGTK